MVRAISEFFGLIKSFLGFLKSIWMVLAYFAWAYVVPVLTGPAFGYSSAEWQWYWGTVAPFLTWLIVHCAKIPASFHTQKWVSSAVALIGLCFAVKLWVDAVFIARAYGWSFYSTPLFALTSLRGGWFIYLATVLSILSLAVEVWLWNYMPWTKKQIEQRIINWWRGEDFATSKTNTHGSARWATYKEMVAKFQQNLDDAFQLVLGVVPENNGEFEDWKVAYASTDAHLLVTAGNRSGKGASVLIPNQLNYRGSALVIDPQLENRWVTAQYREQVLGQKVRWIDPDESHGHGTHGVNILELLDPYSPEYIGDVNEVVKVICDDGNPKETDNAYFRDNAQGILAAIIAVEVAAYHAFRRLGYQELRHPTLRDIAFIALNNPDYIQLWLRKTHEEALIEARAAGEDLLYGGILNHESILQYGRGFIDMHPETWSNITSTMKTKLKFIQDDRIARVLCSNTIDPKEILGVDGTDADGTLKRKFLTVYVNFSIKDISNYPAAVRLVLWSFFKQHERHGKATTKTLTILDELPKLGNMKMIHEYMIDAGAKYGVIMMGVIQDVTTFKELVGTVAYNAWSANTTYRLFSRVGSQESREEVSKLCGKTTASSIGSSKGEGNLAAATSGLAGSGESSSHSEIQRDLIDPSEVGRLPPNQWLVLENGAHPMKIWKLAFKLPNEPFRQHPFLKGKGAKNPLHTPDGQLVVYPAMPREAMAKTMRNVEPELFEGYRPPEHLVADDELQVE